MGRIGLGDFGREIKRLMIGCEHFIFNSFIFKEMKQTNAIVWNGSPGKIYSRDQTKISPVRRQNPYFCQISLKKKVLKHLQQRIKCHKWTTEHFNSFLQVPLKKC